jgi:hypothetical protein
MGYKRLLIGWRGGGPEGPPWRPSAADPAYGRRPKITCRTLGVWGSEGLRVWGRCLGAGLAQGVKYII